MSDIKESEYCEKCGASVRTYRHNMNKGMVAGLKALARVGGRGMLRELKLTISQHNNFQKLRYWDLISPVSGTYEWVLTEKGLRFLKGIMPVHKNVLTYRGQRRALEGKMVYVNDVDTHYKWDVDYIEDSR